MFEIRNEFESHSWFICIKQINQLQATLQEVKNMGRKAVNFLKDEEIANSVKKYPCLYDMGDKFYKDNRAKKNAWDKVEEEVRMEEGKIIWNLCFSHSNTFY